MAPAHEAVSSGTQEGLGGFEAAIIRAEDLPSIVQSEDRDRRSTVQHCSEMEGDD